MKPRGKNSLDNKSSYSSVSRTVEEIQSWLIENISKRVGVDPKRIDINKPFASYGLSSVQVVTISAQMGDWLNCNLSPTLIYDYPNIESLSRYLSEAQETSGTKSTQVEGKESNETKSIAIIGMSCRFPGAGSIESYWKLLSKGVDAISEVPPSRWNIDAYYDSNNGIKGKMNTRWGGFLEDVEGFDSSFFGISPREADSMDPQQRLLLEVSWEALEDAALSPSRLAGSRTGVFFGMSNNDYSRLQFSNIADLDAYSGLGNAFSINANRLSYLLDLRGPSCIVDTACSSSLVTVHLACQSLRRGECELAVTGGVNLILSPEGTIIFSKAGMMAPDGRCKTFDEAANGYVRSEGCGVIVLKSLSDAVNDGDNIQAIIRGSAVNQDGRSNGLTAPNGIAQQDVIRKALKDADIAPNQISYVETHGTGTSLGDPIEVNSLVEVLKQNRSPNQTCFIGSVKTNIGHLESAAGIAGLIKGILCLKHKEIPRNLHFKQLNQHINIKDTPFSIPVKHEKWPLPVEGARIFGISSFGFGGTNAHVVVEEYNKERLINPSGEPQVIVLSARNKNRLDAYAVKMAEFLMEKSFLECDKQLEGKPEKEKSNSTVFLSDIAYTLQIGREPMEERLAIVVSSVGELIEKLTDYCSGKVTIPGLCRGNIKTEKGKSSSFLKTTEGEDISRDIIEKKQLNNIALLWVSGTNIDWELLHCNYTPRRIQLPTYPFANKRHWIGEANKKIESTGCDTSVKLHPAAGYSMEVMNRIQNDLIRIISLILEIDESEILPDEDITRYGFDSITMAELADRIDGDYNLEPKLTPTVFFDHRSVESLSHYLAKEYKEKFINYYKQKTLESSTTEGGKHYEDAVEEVRQKLLQTEDRKKQNEKKEGGYLGVVNNTISFIGTSEVGEIEDYWRNYEKGNVQKITEDSVNREYLSLLLKHSKTIVNMLIKTSSNRRMEVVIAGHGEPILFIPGLGMTAPNWYYQFKYFSSEYQVIVIHKPGHGLSDKSKELTLSHISKDIMDVLNELRIKWPIHIVGTSYGGMFAQYIAKEYPDKVASLVLSGSHPGLDLDLSLIKDGLKFMTKTLEEDIARVIKKTKSRHIMNNRDNYYNWILKGSNIDPLSGFLYFNEFAKTSTLDFLSEIKTRTLIIVGRQDAFINPVESEKLHSLISNSKYYEICEAGHFPYITHHKEFNKKVMTFIKEQ